MKVSSTAQRSAAACLLVLWAAGMARAEERTWAEKMFNKLDHDFGVVARGADVQYRFELTNLYKESVHIADVRTTCGCSAAEPTKTTLASREKAHIEVTLDTRRFTRRKDSNLIVTFDSPLYAEVRIPLTAYIRTDVVLQPGSVDFGKVDQGREANETVEIAYAGRNDWKIRDVRLKNEHFTAEVAETGRGNGRVNYELRVSLKPTAPSGFLREQMTLVTDDASNPHVPVLVEARVEPDITVRPRTVSLGRLARGESKTVNVVLKGKQPFVIAEVTCDNHPQSFRVRVPEREKRVHVVPITVNCPDAPGEFSETFKVTVAGRPQPVTFRMYGSVAANGE